MISYRPFLLYVFVPIIYKMHYIFLRFDEFSYQHVLDHTFIVLEVVGASFTTLVSSPLELLWTFFQDIWLDILPWTLHSFDHKHSFLVDSV